jgi:hypothetical protein
MESIDKRPKSHGEYFKRGKQFVVSFPKVRAGIGCATGTPMGEFVDNNLIPKIGKIGDLYPQWENISTRTPIVIMELKEAEADFLQIYLQVEDMLTANPLVTNEDLVILGFPPRPSGGRHTSPVETKYPWNRASTPRVSCIEIEYGDIDTGGKKKPAGQHGAECRWVISETPVTGLDALLHSSFDTKTPFVLDFPREDSGRKLYYALRWENTRGEKGPFGPIESVIIP